MIDGQLFACLVQVSIAVLIVFHLLSYIGAPSLSLYLSEKIRTNGKSAYCRLHALAAGTERVFPATDLYNEGWMLRLVLDWFSRNRGVDHDLKFGESSGWYSEALLPSAFLPRKRGDKLAESWTHADGVIGHFCIGENGAGDLSLKANATQLVVTEAKMFSKLSAGVKNAAYFNQAARNIACIAELAKRAAIAPTSFDDIAFYVIAPQSRIDEGVFSPYMDAHAVRDVVRQRVAEYEEPKKDQWFNDWFLPTSEIANIRCISWEEILTVISAQNEADGQSLGEFYAQCLEFN